MIGSERTIHVAKVATWLDIDFNWFVHILTYDFNCGCKFENTFDGREEVHCELWNAIIARARAEKALAEAEIKLNKMLDRNKGVEVGR